MRRLFTRPDRIVRQHIRVRYLVTVQSDEGFEGVLDDADDQTLVLVDVVQVAPDGQREPMGPGSRVLVPRTTVKYMQILG